MVINMHTCRPIVDIFCGFIKYIVHVFSLQILHFHNLWKGKCYKKLTQFCENCVFPLTILLHYTFIRVIIHLFQRQHHLLFQSIVSYKYCFISFQRQEGLLKAWKTYSKALTNFQKLGPILMTIVFTKLLAFGKMSAKTWKCPIHVSIRSKFVRQPCIIGR